MGLLLLLTALLFVPPVQQYAGQKASNWFNERFDTGLKLDGFRYAFPNNFYLQGVYLPDRKSDTLIYAHEVVFSFNGFSSEANQLKAGVVELKDLTFNWLRYPGREEDEFQYFISQFTNDTSTSEAPPFRLDISQIEIGSGRFHYRDLTCDSCSKYLLRQLNLDLNGFRLKGPYFKTRVEHIAFDDLYGLELEHFSGDALFQAKQIQVKGLDLRTKRSAIKGMVALRYDSLAAFKDFIRAVDMDADLESAMVSSEDIRYFSKQYPRFGPIQLSGKVQGPVMDMQITDLDLYAANATHIATDLRLRDVTAGKEMFLDFRGLNLSTNASDLAFVVGLFSENALPPVVDRLGEMEVRGNYAGSLNNFKTEGAVRTDLAEFSTTMQIEGLNDLDKMKYQGQLDIKEMDLATITGSGNLGGLVAELSLSGRGVDPAKMNTKISGDIGRLDLQGYSYSNMQVDGRVAEGEFLGTFAVADPNLKLDFIGAASFGKDTSRYDFEAKIAEADLHALQLVEDSVADFSGKLVMDFTAVDYDRWTGQINIANIDYRNAQSAYYFKDFQIRSNGLQEQKELAIDSKIISGQLKGNYTFKGLAQVFTKSYLRYNRYRDANLDTLEQNFRFDLELEQPSLLTELFLPDLAIEPNTRLSGGFSAADQTLALKLDSRGIRFRDNLFRSVDLDVQSGKQSSELALSVNQLDLASGYQIDSLGLNGQVGNDTLQFATQWVLRDSVDSRASFQGQAYQSDTLRYAFQLDSSQFNIGLTDFGVRPGAMVELDSNRVFIQDLIVGSGKERVYVNGAISDSDNEVLRVNFDNLGMDLLNYVFYSDKSRFKGSIDGEVIITQLVGRPKFVADLAIDSLTLNDQHLGHFELASDYSVENDTISLRSSLTLGSLKTFQAQGFYQASETGALHLDADFNRFQLTALNPVVNVVAENLRGMVTGDLQVRGTAQEPLVNGKLNLPKVAFTISFLQTDYNLTGEPQLAIVDNQIQFPELQLRDTKYRTAGSLSGSISNTNFRDFKLDLHIKTNELLVLNTDAKSDDAYYGRAFATGQIDIVGPPDRLDVTAKVESERNTNFNIPIGGATEVKRSGFVTFVDPTSSEDSLSIEQASFDLDKGLGLEFDIAVDQDAQVSIILNQSTGNKLNASGNGQIKLKLEPNQDMQLFGTYTVAKGEYRFNLEGLFAKNFQVERGGTVSWNGDPYSALLDITAKYTTKADPGPFVGELSGGPTLTEVYLKIKGPLTDPDINFEIQTPRASSTVQAILNNRLQEKEAVNQQVFSLLALNSFTPQNNFLSGGGSGINEWDIIANQAASFLNRFTGDYEVSLAYQENNLAGADNGNSLNNNAELEVGLSKDFFNERLTISSQVGVPLNNNQGNIAGDFEIIYSLTPDGRLQAKAFTRSVQNQFNLSFGQQQLYQQGAGLSYRVDFNSFGALVAPLFGNQKGKEEDEPTPEQAPSDKE